MKGTIIKDWLKVLILLLDEAAAVAIILIILYFFEVEVPWPAAIAGSLVLGTLIFVIHKAVIPTFHSKQVTGAEGMIGTIGKVTEILAPAGIVRVGGELWKAKSDGDKIDAGEMVEVVALEGLTLKVRRQER